MTIYILAWLFGFKAFDSAEKLCMERQEYGLKYPTGIMLMVTVPVKKCHGEITQGHCPDYAPNCAAFYPPYCTECSSTIDDI